jgi:putative membrane protein
MLKRTGLLHADSQFAVSMTLLIAILLLGIGTAAIIAMVAGAGPLG